MTTFITIALTVLITTCSIGYGYWLSNKHRELSDRDFFRKFTIEDLQSGTPIAHKLDRQYGFENKM
jgi:hypothetical protein